MAKHIYKFKKLNSLEKRKIESERIILKYPDRIPIIVETHHSDNVIELDKKKYLVPEHVAVSHFMFIIRKRINIEPENAIFMFFGNTLVPSSHLISDVYKNYKDEDGFLYSTISLENTFG
jgi:GABA(A) receptor-associated protein